MNCLIHLQLGFLGTDRIMLFPDSGSDLVQ
jgi:hypothetical protein